MLSRILSHLRAERGQALVFALSAMTVLTMIVTTTLYYTSTSERESTQSRASDAAYRLAETGVNNAMATLGNSSTSALSSTALPSSEATASTQPYSSGTAKWWGTFTSSTRTWQLYGKGVVTGGTGSGNMVTRQVSASMTVTFSYSQPVNAQAWNYIYISGTSGTNSCDTTLSNNVQLDAPLYVDGNLCLSNNAQVREDLLSPRDAISVVVKGKTQFSNGSSIGVSAANTVSSVYLAGGCGSSLTTTHTCKPVANGGSDPIYYGSGGFSTTPPSVTPPSVDWTNDGWYANASPGPSNPCTITSGTPPSFDGGTAPQNTLQNLVAPYANGSLTATQNLTPASSYTCKTGSGELSWNASTHTMTVNGVIYIDGNVSIGDGSVDDYNGQATLYTSGYVTISGSMCGKRNAAGTACDISNWNPNTEMWIIAAHGNNGSGYSIEFPNNSEWEGGIYAVNSVDLSNNATIQGPMIAGNATFSNNVTTRPFPVITSIPLGAPGNPNVYAQPNPPGSYSG